MAEGLNRWTGIGNLTEDSTLRFTQSNTPVLSFRIACSEAWFDKESREKKERTEFVGCTLWGKRAESLSKYLTKGSRVCVEGKLSTRSYEKDGQKRYVTEINVSNVLLLGSKNDRSERREEPADEGGYSGSGGGGGLDDGEIPF